MFKLPHFFFTFFPYWLSLDFLKYVFLNNFLVSIRVPKIFLHIKRNAINTQTRPQNCHLTVIEVIDEVGQKPNKLDIIL